MDSVSLSSCAKALCRYFDDKGMINSVTLVETLESQPEIAAVAYIEPMFKPSAIEKFKDERSYWLAAGLFSPSVVLGSLGGMTPLQTLEKIVFSGIYEEDFWRHFEEVVADRIFSQLGKGLSVSDESTVLSIIQS